MSELAVILQKLEAIEAKIKPEKSRWMPTKDVIDYLGLGSDSGERQLAQFRAMGLLMPREGKPLKYKRSEVEALDKKIEKGEIKIPKSK